MDYFEEEELINLEPQALQVKANEIHQRFAQRRNYYHQFRNSPFIKQDNWNDLNKALLDFDASDFRNWNQRWNNVSKQQNTESYITHFHEGENIFNRMDDLVENFRPKVDKSDDVEEFKNEILTKIDNDINLLTAEVREQISEGLQDLIDLKAEYKLQDTFASSIKTQRDNSLTSRNWFMFLFVGSLILIPTFVLISFSIDSYAELDLNLQWGVRITFAISLAILSIFLFNQYKVYQILYLKYTHLYNFIGGGATFISELIGLEESSKKEINRKLANMFIEIDDIMSSIKKSKHPSENLSETAQKSIDSVAKIATEALKTKTS